MPRKPTVQPPRSTVERKRTGEVKRKLTVYLTPELYRALGHYAVDHDTDMSAAAAEAIALMLGNK